MANLIWRKLKKYFTIAELLAKEANKNEENVTLCCLIKKEDSAKIKNFGQNINVSSPICIQLVSTFLT